MKISKYKTPSGEFLDVTQIDEENKRVLVYFGDEPRWISEEEYSTWQDISEPSVEELPDTGSEEIADSAAEDNKEPFYEMGEIFPIQNPEETISEITENPIANEPLEKKPRKRTPAKKEVKPKAKPKKK